MGRLRIKKKEVAMPFRETLAYRMLLSTGSIVLFLVALYLAIGALRAGDTVLSIASVVGGIIAALGTFYNLDRLRNARIPQGTLKRMKRR